MDNNEAPRLSLRSISWLFGETWKRYKERWSVLMEIILLPTLVVILGVVLIGLDLGSLLRVLGGLIVFIGWIIFAFSVLPIINSIHHGMGVDESYKATIGWFWPFVWVMILQIFTVIGGFVMLIIPGIWLGIALAFTTYVFVIEGRRGIDSLRQSKDYAKGYWWAIFGRVLLLEVVYLVASMIIRIPVAIIGGQVVGAIASMVIVPFFVPFAMVYEYVIFENLRERKPELATAQTKEGAGFLKTSAVVGVVAPVALILLGIVLLGAGVLYAMRHANYHYVPPPGAVQVLPSQQ